MIWFILIYIITLILFGVAIYIDMNKGETLQHYFRHAELDAIILFIFFPIINTVVVICILIFKLLEKLWNKIKYWEK